jgi:hypothetical protein
LGLLLCSTSGWAQKPPAAQPVNPQAPVLNMPGPVGIQRGTSLDLTLTGTNLAGPTGLFIGFPGKVTIPTDGKNGQDNASLKVKIEVPADAPIGYYPLRLATTRGISNLRPFCIDDLPQVVEVDTNRNKSTPQAVPTPCVVAGRADAEITDYFKVTVTAGQRLTFDVVARRMGSAMDPQISLYSIKTGRELAHDNDSPGCQTDCRLTYVFKEAGDYLIEIKDVLNRGGPDYVYRLRIGDFPAATSPIPMAAKRGSKIKVAFVGSNVEGVQPVDVAVPADPLQSAVWVAPKGPTGLYGWPVALAVTDHEELLEQEPNNEPGKANRIPIPSGITGRFQQSGDLDYYVFAAKKGQKLVIEAHTLELYSPTLVYFVVKNAKTGAELAKSNPQAPPPADQRLEFNVGEDGDYLIEVQHLNLAGGPSEVYHLTVTPNLPSFEVALGMERHDLSPGGFAPLLLAVTRKGYAGPIDLSVVGPPGLSGTATIKANQAQSILVVTSKPDMPMGGYGLAIQAKATIDGQPVTQTVSVRAPVSQSLSGLLFPPLHFNEQVGLAVKEKAPFALVAKADPAESVPGMPVNVTITASRDKGFAEEIVFNPPLGLPANVPPPKLGNIAKDKTELKFAIPLDGKTPLGEYQLLFSGKAKIGAKEVSTGALPLNLVIGQPFELKLEPADLKLAPGAKAKVKVTATRKGGYKGPIALEVRKLPAGVTAAKAALNPDQATLEIELAVAPTAAAAAVKDVDVLGTATALNNLQNASAPIALSVDKKK